MKYRSYAKFAQRGALHGPAAIFGVAFAVLGWTVSFASSEFNLRTNIDAISSIQSRGNVVLKQVDMNGNLINVANQLNVIKAQAGGGSKLCLAYYQNFVPNTFSDPACSTSVTPEMTSAVSRAGYTQAVIAFDPSIEGFSLNQIAGPGASSTTSLVYGGVGGHGHQLQNLIGNDDSTCFGAGQTLMCDENGAIAVTDPPMQLG